MPYKLCVVCVATPGMSVLDMKRPVPKPTKMLP